MNSTDPRYQRLERKYKALLKKNEDLRREVARLQSIGKSDPWNHHPPTPKFIDEL